MRPWLRRCLIMNKPKVQKKPIKFDSYEALLGLENIDDDTSGHSVQSNYPVLEINLDELKEFPEHPFKVWMMNR